MYTLLHARTVNGHFSSSYHQRVSLIKGLSNQSQRITKRKKILNQRKKSRLVVIEIDLDVYEKESKKDTVEKKSLKFTLKVIKTKSYKLKSLIRLS